MATSVSRAGCPSRCPNGCPKKTSDRAVARRLPQVVGDGEAWSGGETSADLRAGASLVELTCRDAACSVQASARVENARGSTLRNLASVSVLFVGGFAELPEGCRTVSDAVGVGVRG
jgi:hypothetical protein